MLQRNSNTGVDYTVADHRQMESMGGTSFPREKGQSGELGVQWGLPIGWTAEISAGLSCPWGGGPREVPFLLPNSK